MELRRSTSSHLHYIQAIKKGSIVKTLNVGKLGRPGLVYRAIKDIYECLDAKNLHLPPVSQPKDEFRVDSFSEGNKFEDESSCSSLEEENSKTVTEIPEFDNFEDESSRDKMALNQLKGMGRSKISPDTFQRDDGYLKDNDSDCDTMTLNQLKGMLRRKRKVSGYVDLTTSDYIDLEAPLSSFRLKLSKKKKKHKTTLASSSIMEAAISPKSEEIRIDEDLAYSNCYPSVPIHVKIEAIEQIPSEYLSEPCLDDGSFIGPDMLMDPSVKNSELHDVSEEHCVVNDVLFEVLEHVESCLPDVTSNTSETTNIDDQEWNTHVSVLSQSDLKEQQDKIHPFFHDVDQEMLSAEEDSNIADCSSLQDRPISLQISWQEEDDDKAQEPDNSVNNPFTCSGPSDDSGLSVLGNQTWQEEGDNDELVYSKCYPSVPIHVKIEAIEQITSEYPSLPCLDDDSSIGPDMHMDTSEKNSELHEVSDRHCVLNEVSYDALEDVESSLPDATSITSESTNIDYPEWNIHHLSVLSQSYLKKQQDIVHPPFHDINQEVLFAEEDSNIADYSSLQGYSISHSIPWQYDKAQQPDITVNNPFISLGPSDENSVSLSRDQTRQEEGDGDELQQTDIIIDNSCICLGPNEDSRLLVMRDQSNCFPDPCLGPSDSGVSVLRDQTWQDEGDDDEVQQPDISKNSLTPLLNDISPTTEVEQRIHVADYTTIDGFAEIHSRDGNELSTSNLAPNCQDDLRNTPVNLLSNRKVISPTSQERLCKATHEDEIHADSEQNKCIDQDQLCTDEQTHDKPSPKLDEFKVSVCAEEPGQSSRNEYSINAKQINTTPVNCSKGSLPKGSAISFSQRQMQDIEALAMKLSKELNSMKAIVQDSLLSESGGLNYTNEVKTALTNATKAQKSATKWIGMMNKDCNRFCRIMELSGNRTAEHSQCPVPKNRKRITFADEAGGELCQIKVFKKDEENDTSLLSVVT